jgi:hypothetical protein
MFKQGVLGQSRIVSAMVLAGITAAVCSAQSVTSAHSGTVHYSEGDVTIDGKAVESKAGRFSEIKEQGVLRTGKGRAEVLLTPGVFLRVGEDSAVKLLDNRLVSTRVEMLSGKVILEADDPQMDVKDSPVTLLFKDYEIRPVKHGLVEISADPAEMRVYKGEVQVVAGSNRATVKDGRMLPFSAALTTEKFNDRAGDDLYLWARDRSQNLSAANMSSARSLNSGNGFSSIGTGNWNGGWYFNPYFNMFTFVPATGTFWNPFGYGFFSPTTIYSYYTPTSYWGGSGGARSSPSIGRPLSGFSNSSTNQAAPLSQLQRGNPGGSNGPMSLGSPLRSGSMIGARGGFPSADMSMGQGQSMGANNPSMGSVGASRPSFSGGMGGGGGAAPAPAAAPSGGGAGISNGNRGR